MPADEKKDAASQETQAQGQGQEQAQEQGGGAGEDLNFADMDLSVESVEERISPSETNVFDK